MREVFHEGEQAVQARAGVSRQAQQVGRMISSGLPDGADRYLGGLPILFRGSADRAGDLWASALTGDPGFIRMAGPTTVEISTQTEAVVPLPVIDLTDGPAGFLAIDLATRQRFRFNGDATTADRLLRVEVEQAYGNCPKYIQLREVTVHGSQPRDTAWPNATSDTTLSGDDIALIRRADTLFIASAAGGHGADVSHRGGQPGFVRVTADGEICFKDYAGNNMFQTLGNLAVDPRAGLLFIDFETGSTLQLTGDATVDWASEPSEEVTDTGRTLRFSPKRVVRVPHAIPLMWVLKAYSPYNPDENSA